ncbi:MAG: TlpA family protein disulfide reductase [Acidobacteria bacterium]|nr:TlpA family protein disulfide reductase [Acidobacteriota bacterium]
MSLILGGGLFDGAAGQSAVGPPARLALVDGVYRAAAARAARRNKARAARGARGRSAAAGAKLRPGSAAAVRELDAEGLKQLLSRGGDDPAKARPLLINFWATWCDPCREEMPDLVKIDTEFRPRGLDFVLVSADDVSEIKTGVPAFLRKMKATMPAYILNTPDVEAAMSLVDPRWNGELPATFLLDREGKIVFKHFGRVILAELRPALEKALGGN